MIVLDLHSEQFPQYNRLQQYFGQPYIWCMLHNFGGTLGMFGSLDIINEVGVNCENKVYHCLFYTCSNSDHFLQEPQLTQQWLG